MSRYKFVCSVITVLVFSIFQACDRDTGSLSQTKFDSAYSIALDGEISEGLIITKVSNESQIKWQIDEQLRYTIGLFNGLNGVPDMSRNQISIQNITQLEDGSYKVIYRAKLLISWPREVRVPHELELILPLAGDYTTLKSFYDKYSEECIDSFAHDVNIGIYWYYYRPMESGCDLKEGDGDESLVARFPVILKVSDENSENKFPEYEKIWEDNKLIVTSIFGMNKITGGSYDVGVRAYRQTYSSLISNYGSPIEISLPDNTMPGIDNPYVKILFSLEGGRELEANLFLVPSIQSVDSTFRERYNKLTKISDFVSYSGHSGLGANIRALARMGKFQNGQYQIFLVNGCDTFAYVDESLKEAHRLVNPGFDGDRFFDIITNAMPSYFHFNEKSNMAVINALVGEQKNYRELLADFDISQRAAVTGERDNRWPMPFNNDDAVSVD
ncbi:MAG: hypothetical protein R3B45_02790 [Bdellovibrionota bacterium]